MAFGLHLKKVYFKGADIMIKYKVNFSGFAFIEADDEEDAEERFWYDPEQCYQECKVDTIEEVDSFVVHF